MKIIIYKMENNNSKPFTFIKVDNDKIININCIRWVKKMDECLQICSKSIGCSIKLDTHEVCKINNQESYNRLEKYFR